MPRTKQVTVQQVDHMQEMYEAGWSLRFIAKQLGLAQSTVFYHLDKRDVERRDKNSECRHDRIDYNVIMRTIFLYHDCGLTSTQVGRIMDVEAGTVLRRLRLGGAPPRARGTKVEAKASPDSISLQESNIPNIAA